MRDYRIHLVSTELNSDFHFAVYRKGINEREAVREANEEYNPFGFGVDREKVTEIMK